MTLEERLRRALAAPAAAPGIAGDDIEPEEDAVVPAAVLVAITRRPRPGLILTVRTEQMRTHAGQVAFPGGRIDAGESATGAALREAEEELGMDRSAVGVVAALDPYRTVTGFSVVPVVATIPPDLPLAPHEAEVADWFEAPLDHLLDPANQLRRVADYRGRQRHYYEIPWNGRRIWGATAAMIVNLGRRLQWT